MSFIVLSRTFFTVSERRVFGRRFRTYYRITSNWENCQNNCKDSYKQTQTVRSVTKLTSAMSVNLSISSFVVTEHHLLSNPSFSLWSFISFESYKVSGYIKWNIEIRAFRQVVPDQRRAVRWLTDWLVDWELRDLSDLRSNGLKSYDGRYNTDSRTSWIITIHIMMYRFLNHHPLHHHYSCHPYGTRNSNFTSKILYIYFFLLSCIRKYHKHK